MKKIVSFIFMLLLVLMYIGARADIMGENPYVQTSVMKNGYVAIEAEDAVLSSNTQTLSDVTASNGSYINFTAKSWASTIDLSSANPSIRFDFTVERGGAYHVWVRVKAVSDGSNSAYYAINSDTYSQRGFTAMTDWQWVKLADKLFEQGTASVAFKYRELNFKIDKIIVTADSEFAPANKDSLPQEIASENIPTQFTYDTTNLIKPIEGHPRVFLTPAHVEKLKVYVQSNELSKAWASVKSNASNEIVSILPENITVDEEGNEVDLGSYNSSVLNTIQCRALLYVMGERDDAWAKETIEHARNYLATVTFNEETGDITRQKGMVMTMGAIVYDWCYDHMTENDKKFFIKRFKEICAIKEIGYPPKDNLTSTGGHMGEYEVHRDMLSCGIACYDEDTQMYDYASGIIFNRFAPSRIMFNKSGNHPNGSDYGQFRISTEAYADFLYSRMYPENERIYGEEFGRLGLRYLYSRLPDGMFMKDGDSYYYSSRNRINYSDGNYTMYMMLSGLYGEPYAKGEFLRQFSIANYTKDSFWAVLFANPEADSGLMHELPLAYKTTYPLTSVFARTGWQSGIDADTAVVQMKAYERTVYDHMHADAGHFQIYYKGTLALDAGSYQGYDKETGELLDYGSAHDYSFNKRSVAHNVVTVTDPDESFNGNANDGGQKRPESGAVITDYETLMSDTALRAETKGSYIGPNSVTPAFSYLKTDITSAYSSSKMESNVRSMVFMDLFDKDYPAAFVVFDRVVSTDAGFAKRWNLNSVEEPVTDGTLTIISRTEHGYNGKLVNKTFLPEKRTITKVEGCTVDGKDYSIDDKNPTDWHATEQGGWRIELAPEEENKEDLFLNAMYVTDADGDLPQLEMTMKESGGFVGVSVKDRLVLFAKDCSVQTEAFNINIDSNGYDKVMCMIADVAPGVWNVSGVGINVEVSEGENVLCFEAAPGSYTVAPTADAATELVFAQSEKDDIGDFLIYYNDTAKNEQQMMNCTLPNIEKDGVAYVPVRTIFERMYLYSDGKSGARFVSWDEASGRAAFENASGVSLEIYDGMTSYSLNGTTVTLASPVFTENGTMYASTADFKDFLNLSSVGYDSLAGLLKITSKK